MSRPRPFFVLCVIATLASAAAILSCPVREEARAIPPPGDVNCDGSVSSIDATLILQWSAGLIDSLCDPRGADVNHDDRINSLDALLILQVEAALIPISDLILPPTVRVTSVSGIVGQSIIVQVEAVDFIYYYLRRWSIDVSYDSAVVELQSCAPRTGSVCIPLIDASTLRVSGNDENGLLGNIILATIEFTCSSPGTARLEPHIIELGASAKLEAGTVLCAAPVPEPPP